MDEFTREELERLGFRAVPRRTGEYLGLFWGDGRFILAKDYLGKGDYTLHGAQDVCLRNYDEDDINENFESVSALADFLLNQTK